MSTRIDDPEDTKTPADPVVLKLKRMSRDDLYHVVFVATVAMYRHGDAWDLEGEVCGGDLVEAIGAALEDVGITKVVAAQKEAMR